jgi:LPXTG-motif cell wall-anchored protein
MLIALFSMRIFAVSAFAEGGSTTDYTVTVNLQEDGSAWVSSGKTICVSSVSNPSLDSDYTVLNDSDNDGTFTGIVTTPGTYEVYVRDGAQGSYAYTDTHKSATVASDMSSGWQSIQQSTQDDMNGFSDADMVYSDGTNVWVANGSTGYGDEGATDISYLLNGANDPTSASWKRVTWTGGAETGVGNGICNASFICSDGTNIWVADANSVTNDGYNHLITDGPRGGVSCLIDGVADPSSSDWYYTTTDKVTTTGAGNGFIYPYYICSDGTNIWVANRSGGISYLPGGAHDPKGQWYYIAPDGRTQTGSGNGFDSPACVYSDGTNIWVANQNGGVSYLAGGVAEPSSNDWQYIAPDASNNCFNIPSEICSDGANIWVTNWHGGLSYLPGGITTPSSAGWRYIAPDDDSTSPFYNGLDFPDSICSDGTNIYVANALGSALSYLPNATTDPSGTWQTIVKGTGGFAGVYASVFTDGTNIWTAGNNLSYHALTKAATVNYCTLTLTAGSGGSASLDSSGTTSSGEYLPGTQVSLYESPNNNYDFSSWSATKTGDTSTPVAVTAASGNTPAYITMPSYPVTVKASFEIVPTATVSIQTQYDNVNKAPTSDTYIQLSTSATAPTGTLPSTLAGVITSDKTGGTGSVDIDDVTYSSSTEYFIYATESDDASVTWTEVGSVTVSGSTVTKDIALSELAFTSSENTASVADPSSQYALAGVTHTAVLPEMPAYAYSGYAPTGWVAAATDSTAGTALTSPYSWTAPASSDTTLHVLWHSVTPPTVTYTVDAINSSNNALTGISGYIGLIASDETSSVAPTLTAALSQGIADVDMTDVTNPATVYDIYYSPDNASNDWQKTSVTLTSSTKTADLKFYKLTYADNGDTSGITGVLPASSYIPQGCVAALASTTGTQAKSGYTFAGWSDTDGSANATYAPGTSSMSWTATKDLRLYPVWVAKAIPATDLPSITTVSIAEGTTGQAYSYALTADGNSPITWALVDGAGTLPPGLSLDPATGLISGTPTVSGSYDFSVSATNSYGSVTKVFTMTIAAPVSPSNGNGSGGSSSSGSGSASGGTGSGSASSSASNDNSSANSNQTSGNATSSSTTTPKTGDDTDALMLAFALMFAIIGIALLLVSNKRKKTHR